MRADGSDLSGARDGVDVFVPCVVEKEGVNYTIVFPEISMRGTKAGKCRCGKWRTRREKFWQTMSEFNIDKKTKLPKTKDQIKKELASECDEWLKEPITCKACKKA